MKNIRHAKILELIEKYNIETQEELATILQNEGFRVTQATVSRDIRALKLVKGAASNGGYKYVQPQMTVASHPRLGSAIAESILKMEYAGNIVVIKTYPGMAQPVAACIDGFDSIDILGCVAGDDSILVAIREPSRAALVCDDIRKMLNNA